MFCLVEDPNTYFQRMREACDARIIDKLLMMKGETGSISKLGNQTKMPKKH